MYPSTNFNDRENVSKAFGNAMSHFCVFTEKTFMKCAMSSEDWTEYNKLEKECKDDEEASKRWDQLLNSSLNRKIHARGGTHMGTKGATKQIIDKETFDTLNNE